MLGSGSYFAPTAEVFPGVRIDVPRSDIVRGLSARITYYTGRVDELREEVREGLEPIPGVNAPQVAHAFGTLAELAAREAVVLGLVAVAEAPQGGPVIGRLMGNASVQTKVDMLSAGCRVLQELRMFLRYLPSTDFVNLALSDVALLLVDVELPDRASCNPEQFKPFRCDSPTCPTCAAPPASGTSIAKHPPRL